MKITGLIMSRGGRLIALITVDEKGVEYSLFSLESLSLILMTCDLHEMPL